VRAVLPAQETTQRLSRRVWRIYKTSKDAPYNQIRRIRLFSKKNPLIRADFFMLFTPS